MSQIRGIKWNDLNFDGNFNADEPGLAGVTIYLDENKNGVLDTEELSTVTLADDPETPEDETGQYAFTDLLPGTYTVGEIVPINFLQTFPNSDTDIPGTNTVIIEDTNQVVENVNFGNAALLINPPVEPPETPIDLEALGFEFLEEPIEVEPGITLIATGPSPEDLRITVPFNQNAADTTNADFLRPGGLLGLNLDGSGVTVGVWEAIELSTSSARIRNTHQEFLNGGTSRVTLIDPGTGFSNHATHVAGTIGAVGINPNARGMANQVDIRSYNSANDIAELNTAASLLNLSNHSYGFVAGWTLAFHPSVLTFDWWAEYRDQHNEDRKFGKYNNVTSALDQTLYNNPDLLSIWAAGNDRNNQFTNQRNNGEYVAYLNNNSAGFPNIISPGLYLIDSNISGYSAPLPDGNQGTGYDSLPPHQVAKNTLVVGAIDDITADPYNNTNVSMSTFSSWGPTDDGRMKPDVVANGVYLTSPIASSNTSYASYPGTSMAAPNVTGTAALLYEHYDDLFSATPNSATMKGLLIHTATDAGNIGPDYTYGWGVVDGAAAADFLNQASLNPTASPLPTNDTVIIEGTYTGSPITFNLDEFLPFPWQLPPGGLGSDAFPTGPLKVTLVWTDPAGTAHGNGLDETTPVLVNDLDLSITAPNGDTYNPWTLDPNNPANAAVQTQANHIDNVEQVFIDPVDIQRGQYTINLDNTGTLTNGSQDYSLLISRNDWDWTNPENNAPVEQIHLYSSNRSFLNAPATFTNVYTDPDGDLLTYELATVDGSPLPSWLGFSFNSSANTITFTNNGAPTTGLSTFEVKLIATDPFGASSVQTFRILPNLVIDNYIAGATVFFDANKNGILDNNEPSTTTDDSGAYLLDIPDIFDTNNNGEFDIEEGVLVASGGIDTHTGLPLETPVTALPGANVITLLTSLVTDLVVNQGLTPEEANSQVTTALGIPDIIDIDSFDPIFATNNNEPSGVETFAAMVKTQNVITQTAALLAGATNSSISEITDEVVAAITSEIQSSGSLNLTDTEQLETIIEAAATNASADVSEIKDEVALVIAEANQLIDNAVENSSIDSLEEEFANVQKVSLDKTTSDLQQAGAGNKSIEDVLAENTGEALDNLIAGITPFTPFDPTGDPLKLISEIVTDENITIILDDEECPPEFTGTEGQTSFYNGSLAPLGIGSGILLTSGDGTPPLTNTSSSYTVSHGLAGDADLDVVAANAFGGAGTTQDANLLEFCFHIEDPEVQSVTFDLVFGSDEFPEFSNTSYVDVAGVFVNGQNYAYFNNDVTQPLSVINNNLGEFRDNTTGTLPIEYDGVSKPLNIFAPVNLGTNTIKIAVADTGDTIYDSALLISNLATSTKNANSGLFVNISGTESDDELIGSETNEFIDAGAGNDTINPGLGNDIVDAGEGDDTIFGGEGDNEIDGGDGVDTVVYSGNQSEFKIEKIGDVIKVGNNTDTLTNIEFLSFDDGTISTTDIESQAEKENPIIAADVDETTIEAINLAQTNQPIDNPVETSSTDSLEQQLVKTTSEQVGAGITSIEDVVAENTVSTIDEQIVSASTSVEQIPVITADVDGTTIEGIDLTTFATEQVTVDFTISREADFENQVYFYAVDDITGTVGGVAVGEDGYMEAALNSLVSPVFSTSDDNTETGSLEFEAGSIVVPVIIADGTLTEALSGEAEVYFPYLGANTDNGSFDHIKLLDDKTFGFEDLPNGGDQDFNDIVIEINSIA